MAVDIDQVTRLQSLDQKIVELEKEVAALPKHIAQIEKALDSHRRRLDADRAALAANQKDRKRLEDDIKVHEQKISKLKDQTLQAKNNEQYKAFQNEIDYAQNEIRKCEDRIIELMAESEPLDTAVKKAEASLKDEKEQVEAEKSKARERTGVDQKALEQLKSERAGIVSGLNAPLYSTYERIRKKRGNAVAEVVEGRCSACMMAIRSQFVQDLRKGDQMMTCESCGRILHINAPISFEQDLAAQNR